MALIVEDGSVVAGANTYLDVADANTILAIFGYALPAVTADAEAALTTAAQYLESFRRQFQGSKVSSTQALQFPRSGVYIDCILFASDAIPVELKYAQALAAYETSQGKKLQANSNGQTIIEKSVAGAVTVKYADNGQDSAQIQFSQIDSYIDVLIQQNGSGFQVFRA